MFFFLSEIKNSFQCVVVYFRLKSELDDKV